jgi:hypothetical protein
MLIDEYLPDYHYSLNPSTIEIGAPIERVYPVVRSMDLTGARLLRALFWIRSIPAKLMGQESLGPTLADLQRTGLTVLDEAPPQEFLMGFVGKIWTASGGLQKVSSTDYRGLSDPEIAKAVWSFSLEPLQSGRTLLTTQTRVQCLDIKNRKKLRRYLLFVRPLSGLTRKSALRAIKRQAEALIS